MIQYDFSVLRYSYDQLTQEFINVGVVVYSNTQRFLHGRLNAKYGRASRMFGKIDGIRYRYVLSQLQGKLDALGAGLPQGNLFDSTATLETYLSRILPIDDSSLRFARGGSGVTEDLNKTCEKLYRRYVLSNDLEQVEGRTREDVWKVFRRPLKRLDIASRLQPKRIATNDYVYEFDYAWKNGIWNLYEPISFDLVDESSIREKANTWLGRTHSLRESSEAFKLVFLLGAPADIRLRDAFQHAENILNKTPGKKEIYREEEAEAFAQGLESQLKASESEQVA